MRGRFISAAIIVALVALSLVSSVGAATYTDPKGRYTVTVPNDWKEQAEADIFDMLYTAPGNDDVAFGVIVAEDAEGAGVELKASDLNELFGEIFDDGVSFTATAATLGGQPAQRAAASGLVDDKLLHITVVMAVVDRTTYLVFYGAYNADYTAYATQAQAMFDSFTFAKAPIATLAPNAPAPPPAFIRRLGEG
jgi:hypothetical protein